MHLVDCNSNGNQVPNDTAILAAIFQLEYRLISPAGR